MSHFILFLFSLVLLASCGGPSGEYTGYPRSGVAIPGFPEQPDVQIRQLPPPKPLEQAPSFFAQSPATPTIKIALLLPRSGKYKSLGKHAEQAAHMALHSLAEASIELKVYDTKGNIYGAEAAAKQAVQDGVKLILGPVFSSSTKAVLPVAAERNIQVVSYSNDGSLAESGAHLLGFFIDQQINRVMEYAVIHGVKDFVSVLPNNAYGALAAKTVREYIADSLQHAVLKTEIYRMNRKGEPERLNHHVYSAYHAALNSRSPKDWDEELKAFNEEPIDYPRAMVLPEGGKRLSRMLSLLTQYRFDSEKVTLIGSNDWHTEEILRQPLLQGAYFAATPKDRRIAFEARYDELFGTKPSKLDGIVYDSVALAVALTRLSHGQDYSKTAVQNPKGFIGIDGIFRFNEQGLAERGYAVIGIEDGAFVTLDPAPRSFYVQF